MTTLRDIVDIFELLGDWDQRYQYLVELGEQLPPMPEHLKTDDNKVKGCMSQVWISPYSDEYDPECYHYFGDCDTATIKGVLALLIQLVDGKTAEEIRQLDVDRFFSELKLYDHLSPNRHVGIYAIVELMKQQVSSSPSPARQLA